MARVLYREDMEQSTLNWKKTFSYTSETEIDADEVSEWVADKCALHGMAREKIEVHADISKKGMNHVRFYVSIPTTIDGEGVTTSIYEALNEFDLWEEAWAHYIGATFGWKYVGASHITLYGDEDAFREAVNQEVYVKNITHKIDERVKEINDGE
jgi:hypothetical protein